MSEGHAWSHPDHVRFAEDMDEAGLKVQHYRGRFFWEGPAVVVDDLQDALGATDVRCQWDNMGRDWIVYPRAYAQAPRPEAGQHRTRETFEWHLDIAAMTLRSSWRAELLCDTTTTTPGEQLMNSSQPRSDPTEPEAAFAYTRISNVEEERDGCSNPELYRNFRDYLAFADLDVEVHAVGESEIISPDGLSQRMLIHGIKVLMAKNYIDSLSEKVPKGMAERAAAGELPHRAPTGYLIDKLRRKIVLDDERASYVRRIFEWYASGRYGLDDIHDRCLEDGFTSHPGSTRPIARNRIEHILRNPFYTSRFLWQGQVYPGEHPAIVSQELWDSVQQLFRSREPRRGKYRVHDSPSAA